MPKILVTDATFPTFPHEQEIASRHGASFEVAACKTPEDVIDAAKDVDVLVVQFAPITSAAIERLAKGAAIVRYGIGLDNIDLVAAAAREIRVAYVPDYATGEVADHTVTLMLAVLRKLLPLHDSIQNRQWKPVEIAKPMPAFADSVVGFIGFGRIGREVLNRLKPFGFKFMVSDPFADPQTIADVGATAVDLETLFEMADVITLHAPLTAGTRHVINAPRLAKMKSTAIVVNTARGGLIDSEALADAVRSGRIAGAALDVFEDEPLPADSRLRGLHNLILTPHVAWYSSAAAVRVQALAANEIDRHLSGLPPRCPAPGI